MNAACEYNYQRLDDRTSGWSEFLVGRKAARGPIIAELVLTNPTAGADGSLFTEEAMVDSPAIREHLSYLHRVSADSVRPLITTETAEQARIAWKTVWAASGYGMPIPAACTGPDGEMFYSWDRGSHHLELEIIPGDSGAWFYRNRETEESWGEECRIGKPLSAQAVEKIRLFL